MKPYYLFILLIAGFLSSPASYSQDVQSCSQNAGKDAIYLKDFAVKLESAKPNQKPPIYRATLALRKGVIYRLNVCNHPASEGQAVMRLYDESNLLLSTFNPETGKEYKAVSFECKKSGAYNIVISFRDGKAGEAVGILSYVGK
jgi:hypothetical protein